MSSRTNSGAVCVCWGVCVCVCAHRLLCSAPMPSFNAAQRYIKQISEELNCFFSVANLTVAEDLCFCLLNGFILHSLAGSSLCTHAQAHIHYSTHTLIGKAQWDLSDVLECSNLICVFFLTLCCVCVRVFVCVCVCVCVAGLPGTSTNWWSTTRWAAAQGRR